MSADRHTVCKAHDKEAVMDRSEALVIAQLVAWVVAVLSGFVGLAAILLGESVLVAACAGALSAWMLIVVNVARRSRRA